MNFKKLIVAVVVSSGMSPLAAETVQLYDFESDGWYFKKISENTVELSPISYSFETPESAPSYQGQNGGYSGLPYQISDNDGNYYEVVGIGAHAFEGSTIRGISVELLSSAYQSFTYIGDYAFKGCDYLEYAEIPSPVKTIGESAFEACSSLKHVALGFSGGNEWGSKEITIGINAFKNTASLTDVFFNRGFDNITVLSDSENPNTFTTCGSETDPTRFYCRDPYEYAYSSVGVNWSRYGTFNTPRITYTGEDVTTPPMPTFTSNIPESSNVIVTIGQINCNTGIKDVNHDGSGYDATAYVSFMIRNEFTFSIPLSFNFRIAPAPLTLKVADASREYGEPNPKFDFSLEGFVNGENEDVLHPYTPVIADWTENFPTESSPVGTYMVEGFINLQNSNYELLSIPGNLTITPAPLTISALPCTRQYGQDNPDVKLDYNGFKNNETADTLSKQPETHIDADKSSPVGEYPISVTGAEAQNYSISYEPGVLTITQADQTIEWTQDFSDVKIGDEVDLTAAASSGLVIEYTSSNHDVAEIDGSNVKFLREGPVTITAIQIGDANYHAAPSVEKEITVSPIHVETISLNTAEECLEVGATLQLEAVIGPENATDKELRWESSDPTVASISESGLVSALEVGTTTITAYATDGSGVSASCVINVSLSSGISTINEDGLKMTIEGNRIIFHTSDDDLKVDVFNISGKLVYQGTDRIISLPSGIYIISVSGKTYKIIL